MISEGNLATLRGMRQFRAGLPFSPDPPAQPPPAAGLEPRSLQRGVRLGEDLWGSEDLTEHLELFASLGVNTVALDAVRSPYTLESVGEEDAPGEWIERIEPRIRRIHGRGMSPILNLPIQLDLHPSDTAPIGRTQELFCRMRPSGKRLTIHRFENLIRLIPPVSGVGFVISNWGRCRCDLCEAASFEEEAAYYLRAFTAVLQRHAPGTEVWAFPDEVSIAGLREIQSQIPPDTRFVVPYGAPCAEDREGSGDEEGEVFSLSRRIDSDLFLWKRIQETIDRWENDRTPRAVFADLHAVSWIPLNIVSLLPLFFRSVHPEVDLEEWAYRRMLPESEWTNWKEWRDRVKTVSASLTSSEGPGIQPFQWRAVGEGSEQPHPALNLPRALDRAARRIQTDARLDEIEGELNRIPPGERIQGQLAQTIQNLIGSIRMLLHSLPDPLLEDCERHALENLADSLNLLLSDGGGRLRWNREELPDLNPLRIHRLRVGAEEAEE